MIIVKTYGGMGNQMFQYALGIALAKQLNVKCILDISCLDNSTYDQIRKFNLKFFNITLDTINSTKGIDKIITFYEPPNFTSFSKVKNKIKKHLNSGYNVLLDGYFQKDEYINEAENIINKEFTLKDSLPLDLQNLINKIKKVDSVCLHVRRGDYVKCKKTNKFHGFHGADYIKNALPHIIKHVKKPEFFVFSDDIKWCKNNIKLDFLTTYVDENYAWENDAQYHEVMKNCKHFIIPNSTYSWWAARLSNSSKRKLVVTPKRWFKALGPKSWEGLKPESWVEIDYKWQKDNYSYIYYANYIIKSTLIQYKRYFKNILVKLKYLF